MLCRMEARLEEASAENATLQTALRGALIQADACQNQLAEEQSRSRQVMSTTHL